MSASMLQTSSQAPLASICRIRRPCQHQVRPIFGTHIPLIPIDNSKIETGSPHNRTEVAPVYLSEVSGSIWVREAGKARLILPSDDEEERHKATLFTSDLILVKRSWWLAIQSRRSFTVLLGSSAIATASENGL